MVRRYPALGRSLRATTSCGGAQIVRVPTPMMSPMKAAAKGELGSLRERVDVLGQAEVDHGAPGRAYVLTVHDELDASRVAEDDVHLLLRGERLSLSDLECPGEDLFSVGGHGRPAATGRRDDLELARVRSRDDLLDVGRSRSGRWTFGRRVTRLWSGRLFLL